RSSPTPEGGPAGVRRQAGAPSAAAPARTGRRDRARERGRASPSARLPRRGVPPPRARAGPWPGRAPALREMQKASRAPAQPPSSRNARDRPAPRRSARPPVPPTPATSGREAPSAPYTSGMRIGVISDTHGLFRPAVLDVFRGVDHILHAGDIGGEEVLKALGEIAPVTACAGNNDGWRCGPAGKMARIELG